MKGSRDKWEGLPPSKSLFNSPEGCGLPIGNLTSQMFSNIYLADFDHYVKRTLKMKHYGRYVDDFYFMHNSKERLLEVKNTVTEYLKERYCLTVHPLKIYMQDVRHGVTFLGVHVKPYRNYVKKRTLGQIRNNLRIADHQLAKLDRTKEPDARKIDDMRSRFNSYFGYMGQFKTHGIRRQIWRESTGFSRYFRCDRRLLKISPKSPRKLYVEPDFSPVPDIFPED